MATKGILGRKLGMTQVWDDENRVVPVTVIEAGPCRVVQLKTPERDGYAAVQLAFGSTSANRLSKPELGHLKAADGALYLAFTKRVSREGLPDWLDVPAVTEASLRGVDDPMRRKISREMERVRSQKRRDLG